MCGSVPPMSFNPGWGSRAQALQGKVRMCREQPVPNVLPTKHQHHLQSLHGRVWGLVRPRGSSLLSAQGVSMQVLLNNPPCTPMEPTALLEVLETALEHPAGV